MTPQNRVSRVCRGWVGVWVALAAVFALAPPQAGAQGIEPQTMTVKIDNMSDHHLQFYGECGDQAKRLTYVPAETIITTTWYVARDMCADGEIVIQGDGLRWKFPARDFVLGEYDGALICLYPGVAAQGSYSFYRDLGEKVMPAGCEPERKAVPRTDPAKGAILT